MRKLIALIGILCLVVALCAAGWAAWSLYRHDQTVTGQLQTTHVSLAKEQDRLALLEQERRALAEDYDVLKRRWMEADAQTQRVTADADRFKQRLDALTQERTTLQETLAVSSERHQQFQQQVRTLQEEVAQAAARHSVLTLRFEEAQRHSLSRAELESLAQRWALQREVALDASERLEEISRAYEQLAQGSTPSTSARGQPIAASPPAPQPIAEAARLRRLGDAYLTAHHYPQAAQSYEESLNLKDDATTHAKLAFLYSRFLHDRKQAQRHTALAADSRINPALAALSNAPQATKIPRAHWRLVWDWLTQ